MCFRATGDADDGRRGGACKSFQVNLNATRSVLFRLVGWSARDSQQQLPMIDLGCFMRCGAVVSIPACGFGFGWLVWLVLFGNDLAFYALSSG